MSKLRVCVLAAVVVTGCEASRAPRYPVFEGVETDAWLAYRAAPPALGPSDLLAAFEASAKSRGCSTERLGEGSHPSPGEEWTVENRYFTGVVASCDDGNVALMGQSGREVTLGCTQPTTRERCDRLFDAIAAAR
jgi:hypothetical protein